MISLMAGHSRNQNRFTFFEFRHELKNVEKVELMGDVVQEGSHTHSELLLVHVGVFLWFPPKGQQHAQEVTSCLLFSSY